MKKFKKANFYLGLLLFASEIDRIAAAKSKNPPMVTEGEFDDETNSNLSVFKNGFFNTGTRERISEKNDNADKNADQATIRTKLLLPDLNDESKTQFIIGLSCDLKAAAFCGKPELKCYYCTQYGKSLSGLPQDFIENSLGPKATGVITANEYYLSGIINDPLGARYEVKTDFLPSGSKTTYSYKGVLIQDVDISVTGIPPPPREEKLIALTPDDNHLAMNYKSAPKNISSFSTPSVQHNNTDKTVRVRFNI